MSQLQQLIESAEPFRLWLANKNKEEVVGWTRLQNLNPIAVFLKSQLKTFEDVGVSKEGISFLSEKVEAPFWISDFLRRQDKIHKDEKSKPQSVYASEALAMLETTLVLEKLEGWVAALKSGEYLQGRRSLKQIDINLNPKYCCLGVLVHKSKSYELTNSSVSITPSSPNKIGVSMNKSFLPIEFSRKLYLQQILSNTIKDRKAFDEWYLEIKENKFSWGSNGDLRVEVFLASLNDDGLDFLKIAEFLETFFIPNFR